MKAEDIPGIRDFVAECQIKYNSHISRGQWDALLALAPLGIITLLGVGQSSTAYSRTLHVVYNDTPDSVAIRSGETLTIRPRVELEIEYDGKVTPRQ